jgi:hypothetical protein
MNGSPVAGLVRGWVDLYTRGLPADARAARRDEIDDDLWCEHAEAAAAGRSARSLDADLFLRLLFGLPADVSWRLASRNGAPAASLERRSSTSTRILGLLVIVAVSSLGAQLILSGLLGEIAFFSSAGALVLLLAWMISMLAAALGLAAWLFQHRVGPLGGLGAIVVTFGMLTMFAGFAAPIFVGSAMLTWDLARIGVVSRLVPIVHVATAVVAVTTAIGFVIGAPGVLVGVLLILYMLTWIAIGVSLIRGVPQAQARSG